MKTENCTLVDELGQFYAQIPPPPKGLAAGRERMLAAAALLEPVVAARKELVQVPVRRRLSTLRAFRVISVLVVVALIMTATSGGVILASNNSLPGDVLYPVKLGVEDIRLSLTADPSMQVERNLTFVAERVEEMRGLTEQGEAIPGDVMTRMEAQMDLAVGYTMVAPRDRAPALVEELGRRMYQQQQVLVQMISKAESAQEEDAQLLNTALRLAERVYLAADLANGDPLRMQNEYQLLAEPLPVDDASGEQGQSDVPGNTEAPEPGPGAAPAESPGNQGADPGAPNSSNESNSPGKSDGPSKRGNSESNSLEEPTASSAPVASASAASARGAAAGGSDLGQHDTVTMTVSTVSQDAPKARNH